MVLLRKNLKKKVNIRQINEKIDPSLKEKRLKFLEEKRIKMKKVKFEESKKLYEANLKKAKKLDELEAKKVFNKIFSDINNLYKTKTGTKLDKLLYKKFKVTTIFGYDQKVIDLNCLKF